MGFSAGGHAAAHIGLKWHQMPQGKACRPDAMILGYPVITYLVTGDKPTNRTDEVLAKINELLTEKINAELEFRWIEWTDWQTQYNLALATQSGDIDLIGTATDWLDAWPNSQKGAFMPLSEDMLKTYAPKTWESVSEAVSG